MTIDNIDLTFNHDDNGTDISWTWDVKPIDKVFWKTWKPKLINVKILTDL